MVIRREGEVGADTAVGEDNCAALEHVEAVGRRRRWWQAQSGDWAGGGGWAGLRELGRAAGGWAGLWGGGRFGFGDLGIGGDGWV